MERVLQIGMTNNLGGIETFLMNYYRNINRKNIQFDFINIYDSDLCFTEEIQQLGGIIYNVPNYYKHPIKYINKLIKIINSNEYKIIHCNMNSAVMIYPLIAAKISGAKVIIAHSHNSSSDKGIFKSIFHNINKHFIPLLATHYFACSEIAGKWFFSKKIRKSHNYKIIYNAIDLEKFRFNILNRNEIRKSLNINQDDIVFGHIGRFNKQKNHDFLIDIFYDLHKKNENIKLILVGIGPLMDQVKEKVKELELTDSILFLNQRGDTNKLYSAMDIFLLPSLYEGLPLVGVEAQINGLKCIFSKNVTEELKITDNCEFIPLIRTKWIENLVNISTKRNDNIFYEKFNIKINAEKLEEIYLGDI